MDLQGIEPWTTPTLCQLKLVKMLREYYTTKPQARFWLSETTSQCLIDEKIVN
jgi:hypothetical protein